MRKVLITGLLFCIQVSATEIDSFTLRDPYMEDALPELNAIMQGYLEQTLKRANKSGSCDRGSFEDIFYSLAGGTTWAEIEHQIARSPTLDRRTISRKNSIYYEVEFLEGFGLYLANLGYLMRTGDIYFGSDKLGHFIGIGYKYYKYENLQDALAYGELAERTYFGLETTSIYSYGDLTANLEGYYFWSRLTQGKDAYFTCEDNTWRQNRPFDWADYINPAWDEGINCSRYKNDHVTQSVLARIKSLGFQCPVSSEYCHDMIQRYGLLAPRVVTSQCFQSKIEL